MRSLGLPIKALLTWIKDNISITFGEISMRSEHIIYAGYTDNRRRNKNLGQSDIFLCAVPRNTKVSDKPWYHPTAKPLKLLRDLLDFTTIAGDLVIDPFSGSGSTMIACYRTGRKFAGCEISRKYCVGSMLRFRFETAQQIPVRVYDIDGGHFFVPTDDDLLDMYNAEDALLKTLPESKTPVGLHQAPRACAVQDMLF